jgi:hypothetical protein
MMRTDSVTSVQFMKYADLKAHNFKWMIMYADENWMDIFMKN